MADGFDDIIRDHRTVERMLEEYRAAPDDGLAREICTEVALHSEAEEMVLYPELRRLGSGEREPGGLVDGIALAERAELEHGDVDAQIARVLAAPPIDLREPMAQIGMQVLAHVAFEEAEILPRVRPFLDGDALHRNFTEAKDSIRGRAGTAMF